MNEIGKIVKFLCGDPTDKNCESQAREMLAEMFKANKEVNPLEIVRVVNKEIDAQQKEAGAERSRQEGIKGLLVQVRKERVMAMTGGKHKFSGWASGPGPDEGGPQAMNVITKETTDGIRTKLLQALIDGVAEVEITANLRIAQSLDPNWPFYRVVYNGSGSVPGLFRQGQGQVAETNELSEAVHFAGRCLGYEKISKEAKQHPLAGLYSGRPVGGHDVLTH